MMFPNLSPASKVWVYTSDKVLNASEKEYIETMTSKFIAEWAAHGNQLFGDFKIVEDRFVLLCVDEEKVYASGCSIDSSVHFMKKLGQELNINFFDRMLFYIEEKGDITPISFSDLKSHPDALVFNSLCTTNEALNTKWKKKVSEVF